MPHRQRPGADETFPAGAQGQTFDGPANGVGPVQHPHRLAMFRGRLEHVAQGRDERVDAATEILQVDEDRVACVHHCIRRPAYVAVKTEDGNAVHRILEIRRFNHVVLLVPAQPMLRAESGADLYVAAGGERIERMRQVFCDGCRMGKQRDALA